MAHEHSVFDQDPHFIVDEHTRQIKYQGDTLPQIVQYDHNSERLTFQLPKVIDGHDMTLCNDVLVNYINIDSSTKETSKGAYPVEDLAVLENDETKIALSWLISGKATKFAGKLNFMLCFMCRDADTNITYKWNTLINGELTVGSGMDNGEAIVEEYPDILKQWEEELFGAGDSVMSNISALGAERQAALKAEGEAQKEAIELKGAETLATIPDDYTTAYNMAEEALRKKANAIILETEGEVITVDDATDSPILGLKLYGKSTQDGEPSPEYPQEINSVENASVTVYGKNLLKPKARTETINGVTFVIGEDGSVTANGTATKSAFLGLGSDLALVPGGSYILSGCPEGGAFDTYMLYLHYKESGLDVYNRTGETKFTAKDEAFSSVVVVYEGVTVSDLVFHPMIRLDSFENGDFETYTEQTVAIPHTLHGIPVSNGGNYTDANGQQWICDEVDFERGVYVKRITAKTVDGSISYQEAGTQIDGTYTAFASFPGIWIKETDCFVSDIFRCYSGEDYKTSDAEGIYSNPGTTNCDLIILRVDNSRATDMDTFVQWTTEHPCTVYCPLKEPVETALTDEEIARYKQLRTNYHNTTVLNDSGAYMAIKYSADTEIFLGKQARPSDEQIAAAVRQYLKENPITAGSTATIGVVELLADKWIGTESPYSQVVNIDGVTENSQVDLTPNVEQLTIFYEKDLTLVTENEGGVVTVYAIGQKPTNDYAIQVTIKEVST